MKVYSLQLQQDPTNGVGIRQLNPAKWELKNHHFFFSDGISTKVSVVLGFWESRTSIVTCRSLTRSNRNSGDRGNVDITRFQEKKNSIASMWMIQVYCNIFRSGATGGWYVCLAKSFRSTHVAFKYSISFGNPHKKLIQQVPTHIHQWLGEPRQWWTKKTKCTLEKKIV